MLLTAGTVALAQAPAPHFEVASIRLFDGLPPSFDMTCLNGRLKGTNTMYGFLIWAFDLRPPEAIEMDDQLPSWAKRAPDIYTIEAKSAEPVSEAQCRLRFQTLLADRFKMVAHRPMKEGSFYELVVAPGGPKLQPVTDADTQWGLNITINGKPVRHLPGAPLVKGVSMARLADFLAFLGTPDELGVVDKTGLDGEFKLDLAYSTSPERSSDPDLQTALQKQLGLKLERKKGPVQHFVLDRLEPPSPN